MRKFIPLLCLLASASVAAQPATQAELEACADLRDPLDSLSCFEGLTDRGRAKTVVEVPSIPPLTEPEVATTPKTKPSVEVVVEPPPTPRRAPVQESVGPTVSIDSSVGEEHLEKTAEEKGPTKFTATIVKVEKKGRGILVFHMDNGQVWRQIESRFFAYPKKRSFEVVIDQGVLGDYRMRVEGKGRQTRIRRLK